MTTTTTPQPTTRTCGNHVDGYKPVLVREEVKLELQTLRGELPDRDTALERRVATAAMSMVLSDARSNPEVLARLRRKIKEVARLDLEEPGDRSGQ